MGRWRILKLAVSAVSLAALVVAWRLWDDLLGGDNGPGVVGWVVVLVAILLVPLAPLVATAIPPAEGNSYLITMASFGLVFSIAPLVVALDIILGFSIWYVGLFGCVGSWVMLALRYLAQNHPNAE